MSAELQGPTGQASDPLAELAMDLTTHQLAFIRSYFGQGPARYNVTRAAYAAGVSSARVREWGTSHEGFRRAWAAIEAYHVDQARAAVLSAVDSGDLKAVTWYLERRGGAEWTGPQQESTTKMTIEVVQPGGTAPRG